MSHKSTYRKNKSNKLKVKSFYQSYKIKGSRNQNAAKSEECSRETKGKSIQNKNRQKKRRNKKKPHFEHLHLFVPALSENLRQFSFFFFFFFFFFLAFKWCKFPFYPSLHIIFIFFLLSWTSLSLYMYLSLPLSPSSPTTTLSLRPLRWLPFSPHWLPTSDFLCGSRFLSRIELWDEEFLFIIIYYLFIRYCEMTHINSKVRVSTNTRRY